MNAWILALIGLVGFFGIIYWANKEAKEMGLNEHD